MHWIQFFIFLVALILISKPLGIHIYHVLDPQGKTILDGFIKPLERATYHICHIHPHQEQTWKEYLFSLLLFSSFSFLAVYLILCGQDLLPLNPENLPRLSASQSFNVACSYVTNTNWQSYQGETTMSYASQMFALTVQNFVSPAVGLSVLAAFTRGIVRNSSHTLGNFWVDMIRVTYYLFLPLSIVFAVYFVSQGVPQNFLSYHRVGSIEGKEQNILVQGPIASQEAIKILGTNGGGYTGANSAHPYENPTPLTNFLQILGILAIPAAQVYYFGKQTKNHRHGGALFIAMIIFFIVNTVACVFFEERGLPIFTELGLEGGNLEGKEMRFGIFDSALFASVTTAASNGAVNSMHDSFTPIGGMIPLINMQLGEIIFGGVGSGLFTMLIFVIFSIFIAGLIVGRTPEYFGKKIEAFDMKIAMITVLVFFIVLLGGTALACASSWGVESTGNGGPHGFTEILYAFSSAVANNGSAFNGLKSDTTIYNIVIGIVMLLGRFLLIIPVMILAGSFLRKKIHPMSKGAFPIAGATFISLLIGSIILLEGLAFIPALLMGPVLEQILMIKGLLF